MLLSAQNVFHYIEYILGKLKQIGEKMEEHKILIVGGGGVGSFLAREINRLVLNEQIDLENIEITIADMDLVELKNIKYQNFTTDDLNKKKAEVLGKKYCLNYMNEEIIKEEQLKPFDFIISCVDNAKARKLIFEYCFKENKYFIDLRAEGRAIAIFTRTDKTTKKEMFNTLDLNEENSTSCQLSYELENNIIQNGNLIVAVICSQLILNKLRGEKNKDKYIFYF